MNQLHLDTNHRCKRSGRTPGLNTSQRTSNESRTIGPSPLRAIPLKIVREQRQAISNNSNDNQNRKSSLIDEREHHYNFFSVLKWNMKNKQ